MLFSLPTLMLVPTINFYCNVQRSSVQVGKSLLYNLGKKSNKKKIPALILRDEMGNGIYSVRPTMELTRYHTRVLLATPTEIFHMTSFKISTAFDHFQEETKEICCY